MTILKFNCPQCQQKIEAPEELSGTVINCPTCQEQIQVPEQVPPVTKFSIRKIAPAAQLPPQTAEEDDTAALWKRAVAQIIDFLIVGSIVLGLAFLSRTICGIMQASGAESETVSVTGFGIAFLAFCVVAGYKPVLLAIEGATIGMRIFGIKVVKEDGLPLEFGAAFLRCLVEGGCVFASFGLGMILIFCLITALKGEDVSPSVLQVCGPAALFGIIPYLPAFFSSSRRATHDFVFAKTIVIKT